MSFRDFFRAHFQVPAAKHQGGFPCLCFFVSMMIQLTKAVFVVIWDVFLVKMFTPKRVCETSWLFLGSHQELETPFLKTPFGGCVCC